LLTVEDLSLEAVSALDTLNVRALAIILRETNADRASLEDAFARAKLRWPDALVLGSLSPAAPYSAKASGCRQVVTGFAPLGPTAWPAQDSTPGSGTRRAFIRRTFARLGSPGMAALSQGLLRTPGKNSNPYQRRKR
jgi:hypothetical protein